MDIKVYIHAVDISGDINITSNQIYLMEQNGLLDAAKEIIVCTHYNENNFSQLRSFFAARNQKNMTFIHFDESYKNWFEFTTLFKLKNDCKENKEDFHALYLHSKGSWHQSDANRNWRNYMQYFCIERWKDCVEKLDEGYETCGAGYMREEENVPSYNFYAGNFFWAKSSYINRCRDLKTPPEVNFESQFEGQTEMRYDAEYWHGTGKPKWYDLDPGPAKRWYRSPEMYRK